MSHEMMELTLRIVSRTLFGHDPSGQTDDVARAMAAFQASIGRPDVLPRWIPTPGRARLARAVETLDAIMLGLIEARRRGGAAADRDDLLGALLSAVDEEGDGERLTPKEVRDELVTLFLAGHETTSHALTWTLYLLSKSPGAERSLHAELDRELKGKAPSHEDLGRLRYTEQVLKEAMRIYPPAFTVARRALEDTEIGGYPLCRGSEVMLWIYMTHHDPRWYPQPSAFWPERFAEEEEAKRPALAYLPFGAGARACIGKVFAMMEAKLILATLAQRLRFELAPDQRVEVRPRITLSPRFGMRMTARAR
jgi:cytochrome P450